MTDEKAQDQTLSAQSSDDGKQSNDTTDRQSAAEQNTGSETERYDPRKALAALTAQYDRLNALKEKDRLSDLAERLCKAFNDLSADTEFWNWLRAANPKKEPVDKAGLEAFIDDLAGFESGQARALERLKVGKRQANVLAQRFTTNLHAFRGLIEDTGTMISPDAAVQSMLGYVNDIGAAVCRDGSWENVSKALEALGVIVVMGGAVAAAATPAGWIVPIIGAALSLAGLWTRHRRERR